MLKIDIVIRQKTGSFSAMSNRFKVAPILCICVRGNCFEIKFLAAQHHSIAEIF